jgi:hypothetical protein
MQGAYLHINIFPAQCQQLPSPQSCAKSQKDGSKEPIFGDGRQQFLCELVDRERVHLFSYSTGTLSQFADIPRY